MASEVKYPDCWRLHRREKSNLIGFMDGDRIFSVGFVDAAAMDEAGLWLRRVGGKFKSDELHAAQGYLRSG